MREYERATATKDFSVVAPLIDPGAFYRFTDGDFVGIEAIREAFNATWQRIKDEVYTLSNIRAIVWNNDLASVTYDFTWEGEVDGTHKSGKGRGFNTLARNAEGKLVIWNEILTN